MKALALFILLFVSVPIVSAQPVVVIVRHAEKANGGNDPDLSSAGRARAAVPTATLIHVTPTMVAAKDTTALVGKLHQLNGNALVVGHGDTIPNIVKALGINSPINIPDADYSELLIVTLGDKPQLFRLHYSDDERSENGVAK